jgi:hypothetical protein
MQPNPSLAGFRKAGANLWIPVRDRDIRPPGAASAEGLREPAGGYLAISRTGGHLFAYAS